MPIKQGNKRITVTLDKDQIKLLDEIKKTCNCKSNAKAIKWLIDIYLIRRDYEKYIKEREN